MSQDKTVILVHGIGSPSATEKWIEPLNASLAFQRFDTLGASDRIINVNYREALLEGTLPSTPARTWSAPDDREQAQNWADFLVRRDAMASTIAGWRKTHADLPLDMFGGEVVDSAADLFERVRRYARNSDVRNAVWSSILEQIPSEGHVFVVAHSLGAVVMLDLLSRLPASLHVDLLLTIGAPFAVGLLRSHHGGLHKAGGFPADRVGCWVNVFDPDDIVTVGRGAQRYFPAAIDASIDTGWSHDVTAYMSQPVVGLAFGTAAFGSPVPSSARTPARRIHPLWQTLMLRFAFTHQLWGSWPKDEWRSRRRLDLGRRILAERAIGEANERRARALEQADLVEPELRDYLLRHIGEAPYAEARMPTVNDLWRHAGEHMRDQYSDEELVIAGIDLLLSQPLAPFGIKASTTRMTEALAYLAQRIRRDGSSMNGKEYAEALAAAVKEAKSALSEDSTSWAPFFVTAGVLVLAATGIGLAVAAPAGLAGAAAIASTLATFGPGGMAGGVASLAVLSGTSAALTTAGLSMSGSKEEFAKLQDSMAYEVAQLPRASFRTALAGLLAVTRGRQLVDLDPRPDETERVLLAIQETVLSELANHQAVAPESDQTEDWESKADLLAKALDWLQRKFRSDGIDYEVRTAVVKYIEDGTPLPELDQPRRRRTAELKAQARLDDRTLEVGDQ